MALHNYEVKDKSTDNVRKNEGNIRFDIPHGVKVTITVFWDVTPYILVGYKGLKRYILPASSEQKMEAAGSSETPVTIYYVTTEKMQFCQSILHAGILHWK
jgi:hypothetical protein